MATFIAIYNPENDCFLGVDTSGYNYGIENNIYRLYWGKSNEMHVFIMLRTDTMKTACEELVDCVANGTPDFDLDGCIWVNLDAKWDTSGASRVDVNGANYSDTIPVSLDVDDYD